MDKQNPPPYSATEHGYQPPPGFHVPPPQMPPPGPQSGIPQSGIPQSTHTVIVTHAAPLILGPQPVPVLCPSCHAQIVTTVETEATTKTHLFALLLCLFGRIASVYSRTRISSTNLPRLLLSSANCCGDSNILEDTLLRITIGFNMFRFWCRRSIFHNQMQISEPLLSELQDVPWAA